jgi:hypothetical protein
MHSEDENAWRTCQTFVCLSFQCFCKVCVFVIFFPVAHCLLLVGIITGMSEQMIIREVRVVAASGLGEAVHMHVNTSLAMMQFTLLLHCWSCCGHQKHNGLGCCKSSIYLIQVLGCQDLGCRKPSIYLGEVLESQDLCHCKPST